MLTRREFLQTTAMAPFASMLPQAAPAATTDAKKPNVLFMIVDDLCPRMSAYGYPEVKAPNMERLAKKGVRFDRNYCQYPVCNPSRQSILSGLRPETTGIVTNWEEQCIRKVRPQTVTLPQLLRQNGYYTASIGKVAHRGMDATGKLVDNADPPSWVDCTYRWESPNKMPGEGHDYAALLGSKWEKLHFPMWRAAEGDDADQEDQWQAQAAIKTIDEHKDKDAPFFLAVGFHKPHDPYVAPKKYFDLYPLESITLPEVPADRSPNPPPGIPIPDFFAKFTDEEKRELKRSYFACVSFVDAQIGLVLDHLDQTSLWDNTIVVLVADHGYHLWEHNWLTKCTPYELSAHVPLIVWAPGQPGMGKNAPGLVESLDLYPSLAALCGVTPPAEIQGTSFVPLLKDPTGPGKEAAYTTVMHEDANFRDHPVRPKPGDGRNGYSVRNDRYRFTQWSDGQTELYDHTNDPIEYHDLSHDPDHQPVVAQMTELLKRRDKPAAKAV